MGMPNSDESLLELEAGRDEQFVALCARLRQLGATSVKCGTRKATFTTSLPKPTVTGPKPDKDVDPLERFPRVR